MGFFPSGRMFCLPVFLTFDGNECRVNYSARLRNSHELRLYVANAT